METLGRAVGSPFLQHQISSAASVAPPSVTTARATSPSSQSVLLVGLPAGNSTSPTCCETGVILSPSPLCSSLINSLTASSCVDASSINSVQASPCTTSAMVPATVLVTTASTPSLSAALATLSNSTSPVSMACSTLMSSTTTSSAPTNPSHQMLLNGLGGADVLSTPVNLNSLADDSRALQLALELSMVGFNNSLQLQVHQQQQQHLQQLQQQHLYHMQHQQKQLQQSKHHKGSYDAATFNVAPSANALNTQTASANVAQLGQFPTTLLPGIEDRAKKSQNMTECVPVPSSEHVAEIVGRQGCKIKALRAKTNTYIKTPVRGEEPVFVVTGRKEDVAKAKREILSAAEHFSVIRASRKPSFACNLVGSLNGSSGGCNKTPPGPPLIPGHVTIQVRVPYRVVGLVVGSKGATIKHIQQETQTYIVTPSREKEPIFDVSGLPENVQAARKQIEAHIAMRTGTAAADEGAVGGIGAIHTINSLSQILNDDVCPEFLASIYKNGLCSTFDYPMDAEAGDGAAANLPIATHNNCTNFNQKVTNPCSQPTVHNAISNSNNFHASHRSEHSLNGRMSTGISESLNGHQVFSNGLNLNAKYGNGGSGVGSVINGISMNSSVPISTGNNANGMSRSCSSASSTTSSKSTNNSGGSSSRPELSNIWKNMGDSLDVDEGIGESPSIWNLTGVLNTPGAHYTSSTTSISPTDSLLRESNTFGQLLTVQQHQQHRETISNDSNKNNLLAVQQQQQQQMMLQQSHQLGLRRECLICNDKEVTAALVPCGHNMFCMECAKRICASAESVCPACSQSVFHAMRILP